MSDKNFNYFESPPSFKVTKSLFFDGVDELVGMGNILNFERTDVWAASFWFKTTASGSGTLFGRQLSSGSFRGWNVQTANDKLRFQIIRNLSNRATIDTVADFNDGAWHWGLVENDGTGDHTGLNIFIDNVDVPINVVASSLSSGSIQNGAPFQAGARGVTPLQFYNGGLHSLAIYSGINLTSAQRAEIYNGGSPNNLEALTLTPDPTYWWRFGDNPGDNYNVDVPNEWVMKDSMLLADGTSMNMELADVMLDAP